MRHFAFILTGRKEKAGNSSRLGFFHHTHCFNVGEGDTSSSNTACQYQSFVQFMFGRVFCLFYISSSEGSSNSLGQRLRLFVAFTCALVSWEK